MTKIVVSVESDGKTSDLASFTFDGVKLTASWEDSVYRRTVEKHGIISSPEGKHAKLNDPAAFWKALDFAYATSSRMYVREQ